MLSTASSPSPPPLQQPLHQPTEPLPSSSGEADNPPQASLPLDRSSSTTAARESTIPISQGGGFGELSSSLPRATYALNSRATFLGSLSSSPATADFSSGTGGSSSYYIPASASSYPIPLASGSAAILTPSAAPSGTMPPNLAPEHQPPAVNSLSNAANDRAQPHPNQQVYHAYSPTYMARGPPSHLVEGGGFPLSSSTATPGLAAATAMAVPPAAYAAATPWTLGSTDGEMALQLALMRQQEAGGVAIAPVATTTTTTAAPAAVVGTNGSVSSASSPAQQQLRRVSAGGGAVGGGGSTTSGGSLEGTHSNYSASGADPYLRDPVSTLRHQQSLYQDRLIQQASPSVESVLAASCEVMGFDIAEVWLRTGPKTHQLTNSHLRPTALEDSVRQDLVEVYYGEKSSERTHRLSPALCKRAKEAGDVVWVSAHTQQGADALRCSISNVRTAVAIPVCHEASNTNVTIIFFSIRRIIVRPTSVEFLVHMALAAGVASVNSLSEDGLIDRDFHRGIAVGGSSPSGISPPHGSAALWALHDKNQVNQHLSQSEHAAAALRSQAPSAMMRFQQPRLDRYSVTGAQLDLQWRQLRNVEYLTDGGNSWIHTAVFDGKPVVVKTLKPECQDVALAINEIEGELSVHSRLHHPNIVELLGAGTTSKGVRFVVLERLDGGTLSQRLGYDTRIRDRRRRFWRKKHFSYLDVLRIARSIAQAMAYCHEEAIPGSVVLHRDLKPDNIGFTLDGTVKILDFGLAKIVENANVNSDELYTMSGETGSLRYMAPEVADALPYNHFADVYSFGIILWEINAGKKPFDGLNRELFYERVVHGGERPPLHRKWPRELNALMSECWDADLHNRPRFRDIVQRLGGMLDQEKGGTDSRKKPLLPKLSGIIDRHSTWF